MTSFYKLQMGSEFVRRHPVFRESKNKNIDPLLQKPLGQCEEENDIL